MPAVALGQDAGEWRPSPRPQKTRHRTHAAQREERSEQASASAAQIPASTAQLQARRHGAHRDQHKCLGLAGGGECGEHARE